MATHSMSIGAIRERARESWVPMIAIALGQMIFSDAPTRNRLRSG
jgi:hypothetical protein